MVCTSVQVDIRRGLESHLTVSPITVLPELMNHFSHNCSHVIQVELHVDVYSPECNFLHSSTFFHV